MNKLTLNLDATALGNSGCILSLMRTICGEPSSPEVGGYREKVLSVNLVYGIAVHNFIDTMYKTNGHIPRARAAADNAFTTIPFIPDKKKQWMNDIGHLRTTCLQVWTEFVEMAREKNIEKESNFELLQVRQKCYYCGGGGEVFKENLGNTLSVSTSVPYDNSVTKACTHCNSTGFVVGSATEINFKIPYYEDEYICIYLCGTMDRIGKFRNGCYCIRDWKTTGSWEDGYFVQYELSRQLRFYNLACKLMGQMYPESEIGKMGLTQIGVGIDAIFLRSNANETVVETSDIYQFKDEEIADFRRTLDDKIQEISYAVKTQYFPKQGILNGACEKKFSKCSYWNVCKSSENVAQLLLNRDFVRKPFNPLAYNK